MREKQEWVQIFFENADDRESDRVLLIGDSITHGYYPFVSAHFKGRVNVDELAMSYSPDNPAFSAQLNAVLCGNRYRLIHFNNGLHGKDVPQAVYAHAYEEALLLLSAHSRIAVAESTAALLSDLSTEDAAWREVIRKRNTLVTAMCDKYGFAKTALFEMSLGMKEYRKEDGVHYTEEGSRRLAEQVIAVIERELYSIK